MTLAAPSTVDDRFRLTEALAHELAEKFGTPLYVVDEKSLRNRIREYQEGFRAAYPKGEITFASKANSALALLKIAHSEGCDIDVASEGELRAAMRAGIPASDCHLHGNNKSREELAFGLELGVGTVIVDHFGEIEMLASLGVPEGTRLVLRLAPGVDPVTHAKISTGQADTKFGFNITDDSAEKALARCLELELPVQGFHCHVGSQLLDPEAQRSGGELIARFAAEMAERHGFLASYLNVGGGLGVRYTSVDQPMSVAEYCPLVVAAMRDALKGGPLDLDGPNAPILAQEPGRSLVGEAGVTLYRIGVRKTVPAPGRGSRTYLAVDGGLSDNPRPVMYGSKYTVELVSERHGEDTELFTVSGKHCETDKLFEDVRLPAGTKEGDLLQVLVTGAYNSSMASNYNRYPRPATALVREDGRLGLIQRRDDWDEMFARESVPEDLQ
ncbi:diaminopimelate decarboxylase [soil metagenome]